MCPNPRNRLAPADVPYQDLSKNRFSEVPSEVTNYTSLEHLNLYQNVIKSLPDSLTALHTLTHLNLSRNQLSVVPGCVCSLAGLRVLDVSGNRLVSLPEELGRLNSLMDLDASYNQLAHLPPALGELDSLRRLNLRRNLLQTLPPEVCFLRLVVLDLSGNRLSVLPTELRFMSSLLNLSLHSNPLHHPPANLCTRGRVHIFKWLELAAAKEDKKRGALTSEVEFRKSHLRKPSTSCTDFRFVNGLFEPRHSKRSTMDSGYSTCDSVDQRWSHESQESLECEDPRKLAIRAAALTKEQRQERGRGPPHRNTINGLPNGEVNPTTINGEGMGLNGLSRSGQGVNGGVGGDHGTSGPSTPSTLSPGDTFNLEDEFNKALKLRQDYENVFLGEPQQQQSQAHEGQSHCDVWNVGGGCHTNFNITTNSIMSSNTNGPLRHPPDPPHPPNHDPGGGYVPPSIPSSYNPHTHIPTYREYVEAKLQKRAIDSSSVYRRSGSGGGESDHPPASLHHHPTTSQHPRPVPATTAPSKSCNGLDGYTGRLPGHPRPHDLSREDMTRADVKAIQKEAVLSYVKSRVSPSKGSPSSSSPDVSFDSMDGCPYPSHGYHPALSSSPYTSQTHTTAQSTHTSTSSHHHQHHTGSTQSSLHNTTLHSTLPSSSQTPLTNSHQISTRGNGTSLPKSGQVQAAATTTKTRRRSGGGRSFDPDANPAHLSFTYRRELEKQQHEKQLVEKLRTIIETRLKVSLPADISSALMDGVVLCHLANHVRPRSVSSIHVPSPAVPKLTIAKCRLNVENFLEACRRIGVEDEYTCTAHDILEERGTVRVAITVERLLQFYQGRHAPMSPRNMTPV
ncbi:hypothetical protein Pmani_000855 [Petrolisthes manimaculis]|uniref:Calponin-homology (CH) domain-containing protein n=1 Tax=Petrolisthes manimaculis TaxID=1843537 RepID=A0AAE1QP12_9EUCA|nr:hypothetical protein Pmani_000855 [Petrolisthes manimaculis]